MIDLDRTRDVLREHDLDAWLLYDFRGSNPVFWHVFGTAPRKTTRRLFCVLPATGEPILLASPLDRHLVGDLGVAVRECASWTALGDALSSLVTGRVAMEVSHLPIVSWVDAGTVEIVRTLGAEVVSSAAVFQAVAAAWDKQALASHREAVTHVLAVRDLALARAVGSTEADVARFIEGEWERRGLETEGVSAVAAGPHAGDPHYEPGEFPIEADQVLLLDLWARLPGERNVFGDVTWMAWTGPSAIPDRVIEVFDAVAAGRDAALALLERGGEIRGFEVDRTCRAAIAARGFGDSFIHRTGHSLGPGPRVHGLGANLDDLETHDDRLLIEGTGFTVEPGVYLPEFGVRLEIDVYRHPSGAVEVTTPIQRELQRLS